MENQTKENQRQGEKVEMIRFLIEKLIDIYVYLQSIEERNKEILHLLNKLQIQEDQKSKWQVLLEINLLRTS